MGAKRQIKIEIKQTGWIVFTSYSTSVIGPELAILFKGEKFEESRFSFISKL